VSSHNKRAVLRTHTGRGLHKASADPRRGEPHGSGGGGAEWGPRRPRNIQMLEFVVDSFGLDSVLPTEGAILDSYHEVWMKFHLYLWAALIGYLR